MDALNRWAIGLGAGIFAGMAALGVHHVMAASAVDEMSNHAMSHLTPDFASLDVTMQFDTYDMNEFVHMAMLLQEADVERAIGCGSGIIANPAHVCSADATIPDALDLKAARSDVVRDSYTLTIGEYRSEHEEILKRASSILVDTGTGPRPVTYEGNGTFTLGYLGRTVTSGSNEPWQFAVASVGYTPVWLTAGALAAIVSVLVTACFRPQEEPVVEEMGVEIFDVFEGDGDRD